MDGSNLSPRWISSRFTVGSDDCETNLCAARFAATEDGATEVNSWKSSRREISSDPWMIRRFGSVFEKCNYIFALRRDVLSSLFFVPFRSSFSPRVVTVSGGIYELRRIAMAFVEIAGTSSFAKVLRGLVALEDRVTIPPIGINVN